MAGQAYSTLADTLSILGFAGTCWVLWETTRLRKEFLSRVRLPEIHADLENYSGQLTAAMQIRDQDTAIAICSKTQVAIELLKKKINPEHHPRVDIILGQLAHVSATRNATNATIKPIYEGIIGLLELLSQLQKDAHWSGK